MQKCPVCRARVETEHDAEALCRRCGSDLSSLRETYAAAARLQTAARIALARDQDAVALHNALRARNRVDNAQTRRTLMAALLKNGLFRAAIELFAAQQ